MTDWSMATFSPYSLSHCFIGSCFYGYFTLIPVGTILNISTRTLLKVDLVVWSLGHALTMETGEAKLFFVTILVKPHAISSRHAVNV